MQYVAALIRLIIVIIWVYMISTNPMGSAPCMSWVAFILISISLCLNRIMTIKWTPCLLKCFNKKK